MNLSRFHVMTMVSNPVRFKTRYDLYRRFSRHMAESGVNFWTVEVAFGDRPFEVTDASNPRHLQLRTEGELWHKENALNLLAARLPMDWESVAWIDADIEFTNWRDDKAWYIETVEALQHYDVVQLFQNAVDLGPNGETIQVHNGFVWSYLTGKPRTSDYYPHWHPGFAWAARRRAWDDLGGLIDYAAVGSADNHMAFSLINELERGGFHEGLPTRYVDNLVNWQEQAERYVRRNIGYIPGTILHNWHGRKANRKYSERNKILIDESFDPARDLKRDWQGLYQLVDHGDERSIRLRDKIRAYFRARNEDSIDL